MAQINVTLVKSCIGQPETARKVVQSLGLKRLHQTVTLKDNNCTRGMINKVSHLVRYTLGGNKK